MRKTLVDSGPLIALFNRDDTWHEEVIGCLRNYRGRLMTSWPVLTEVTHMLDFSVDAQTDFLGWIDSGAVEVISIEPSELSDIADVMKRYEDLPADFADASLLLISELHMVDEILSIDQDFYVYRKSDGSYLKNILS